MIDLLKKHSEFGFLIFFGMLLLLLLFMRYTRESRSMRDKIKYPLVMAFFLLTILDICYILGMPLPQSIGPIFWAALYLTLAILVIRLAMYLLFDVVIMRSRGYRMPRLLRELTSVVLFVITLIFVLQDTLKIQVTTVLATSALITVVLGLALQETLGNLFAGLSLHLDPPYSVGDWIHSGEVMGKVEEITWRATKLLTVNNDMVVIPNGQIAKEKLINHSYPSTPHAVTINVSVSYNIPPNKVSEVMSEAMSKHPNVVMYPAPDIRVYAYQDFGINYVAKFWIADYGQLEPTLAQVRSSIWYHFRRNDIEIPYPIRNVYLHEREEMLSQKEQTLRHLSQSLHRVYLFAQMDEEERRLIADHLILKYYAKKETILKEGDAGDSFFIVDEGEVQVFISSSHGHRKILSTLREGDFFGEMALLTGQRRTATVEALTDVRVYELRKERFREVLERKPEILDEISSVLSIRKERLSDLAAEETLGGSSVQINPQDAKTKILGKIRDYFGL